MKAEPRIDALDNNYDDKIMLKALLPHTTFKGLQTQNFSQVWSSQWPVSAGCLDRVSVWVGMVGVV